MKIIICLLLVVLASSKHLSHSSTNHNAALTCADNPILQKFSDFVLAEGKEFTTITAAIETYKKQVPAVAADISYCTKEWEG